MDTALISVAAGAVCVDTDRAQHDIEAVSCIGHCWWPPLQHGICCSRDISPTQVAQLEPLNAVKSRTASAVRVQIRILAIVGGGVAKVKPRGYASRYVGRSTCCAKGRWCVFEDVRQIRRAERGVSR